MKVTLNWLKQYVDFNWPPEELADRLTMIGIEVEGAPKPAAILILELLGVWCPRFSVPGGGRHPKGWTPNAANPSK